MYGGRHVSKQKKNVPKQKKDSKDLESFLPYILICLFVFIAGLVIWGMKSSKVPQTGTSSNQTTVVQKNSLFDPLTGNEVDVITEHKQIYAVMIDEHVDARPQSGIDQAFLVIEAPVEGGLPRLMAFFTEDQLIEKIGPVRSARPYFIDWAKELDAMYVHVGGSDEALGILAQGGITDLNEFSHAKEFWRASDRFAPHNAYTSTERLLTYVKTKNLSEPLYGVWRFKRAEETEEIRKQSFVVAYAGGYDTRWNYDSTQRNYIADKDVVLQNKQITEIRADNVAVIVTDVAVLDRIGRKKVRTIGEGVAIVYQDGKKITGTWKKPTVTDRLRFFNEQDEEIEMNAGVTWIEVIETISQLKES